MLKQAVLTFAIFGLAASAHALNLKEKKALDAAKKEVAESHYNAAVKKNCGVDIPTTIDEKIVGPYVETNNSIGSACVNPIGVIGSMCEDATSKAEIVKKIKKVTCTIGKPDSAEFKLNGTEFVLEVGAGGNSNLDRKIREFLEGKL